MGENMTDKMKLLDELMNNALQIPKFEDTMKPTKRLTVR